MIPGRVIKEGRVKRKGKERKEKIKFFLSREEEGGAVVSNWVTLPTGTK